MRRTLLILATALLVAAPAADAATYPVLGGRLDWTLANQYTGGSDTSRTFLGYITNTTGGPAASNGSVTPSGGASAAGPTGAAVSVVDPTAARGLDQLYTFTYPVLGGGSLSDEVTGTFELIGSTSWTTHGLPLTLVNPQITLNGVAQRGTLRATGVTADQRGTASTYDRSKVQFDLDLTNAQVVSQANGVRTITGIVPVSTNDTALAGFGPGSTRYGTMSLTLALVAPAPLASPPATGATGPAGANGRDGVNGKDAEFKVIRLSKAPFATKSEVHVRLIDRSTGKTVAKGTIEQRTLRLGLLTGTTLKGTYSLKRTAKQAKGKLQATITIK